MIHHRVTCSTLFYSMVIMAAWGRLAVLATGCHLHTSLLGWLFLPTVSSSCYASNVCAIYYVSKGSDYVFSAPVCILFKRNLHLMFPPEWQRTLVWVWPVLLMKTSHSVGEFSVPGITWLVTRKLQSAKGLQSLTTSGSVIHLHKSLANKLTWIKLN